MMERMYSTDFCDLENKAIAALEEVNGMKFSDEQLKILKCRESQKVLACAGSGKTTTISNLICKRLITGEISHPSRLVCLSFSREAAKEMQSRLDKMIAVLNLPVTVNVRTIHSFLLNLITTFGMNCKVGESDVLNRYIRDSLKDVNLTLEEEDFETLKGMLSFQTNNLMSDSDIVGSWNNTIEIDLSDYAAVRGGYAARKQKAGVIDYDDMLLIMYNLLNGPQKDEFINYIKAVYDYFIIDEAQDTSVVQFEVLRAMISHVEQTGEFKHNVLDKNLVYVGDDDQCIYRWRGANPNIIMNINGTFEMTENNLSTNYRCGSEIVDFAYTGIKRNANRNEKSMRAFNEGGHVTIVEATQHQDNIFAMTEWVYVKIKELHESGVKYSDMAVITRLNRHVNTLKMMLVNAGIFTKSADRMRVSDSLEFRDIESLVSLTDGNTRSCKLTTSIIWKLCPYLSTKYANVIGEIQNQYGLTFSELLDVLMCKVFRAIDESEVCEAAKGVEETSSVVKTMFNKLRYGIRSDGISAFGRLRDIINGSDKAVVLRDLLYQYYDTTSNYLYKNEDRARNFESMVKYVNYYTRKYGIDKTKAMLKNLRTYEKGDMFAGNDLVNLTTAHSAKGKEWKVVFMLGCDDYSSPSRQRIDKLIKDGVDKSSIYDYIDDERRLHYVSCTRAKEQLYLVGAEEHSMFVMEQEGLLGNPSTLDANMVILSSVLNGGVDNDQLVEINREGAENTPKYKVVNWKKEQEDKKNGVQK